MNAALQCDEALVRRLPLPLAQLYRRAHNAHRAKERKETAYCLWEAAIKLLGCVCVCEYAQLDVRDPRVDESLQNLARPALGHWVGFIRLLLPTLRDHKVRGFDTLHDALLRRRDDLPRVASLYAVLWQIVKKQPSQRTTVQPLELFDRLTEFRNQEVGHGAIGQRDEDFYTLVGNQLLAGAADLLSRVDLLAGRHLYYLQDLRKDGGLWISHRLELDGQSARSVEPLTWSAERGAPPIPQAVYVDVHGPKDEPGSLCCLQPLVIYDEDDDHLLFLNSRTGNKKTEYLSYQSGKHVQRPDLGGEHRALLRRVLKLPALDEAQVAQWVDRLEGEERDHGVKPEAPERQRRIGEFELVSELGRGGQSIVYRAVQPSLNREVALKRLLLAGNPNMDRHFLREIRALGRVDHPNLIKIYTSGVDDDQWYYAMELIEGANLGEISSRLTTRSATSTELDLTDWHDMLEVACDEARQGEKVLSADARSPRPGSLPDLSLPEAPESMRERLAGQGYVERIVELIRQVATATHALHQAGIIHRDIKPANIMVDRRGERAVLMDLGLAKLTDQSTMSMSVSMGRGGFVGTYRYASPEQANPQLAGLVNERSDIYSLGATLWELLTLKPLFGATGGSDPDLIRKIQQDDPPLLRSIHRKIHPDLEAIVARCLEKRPARRYSTAQELAEDLQRYLDREPVQARPVSRFERVWRYICRRPMETFFALVCLLGLVAVGSLVVREAINQAAREQVQAVADKLRIMNGNLTEVNKASLEALGRFQNHLEDGPFKRDARLKPFRLEMRRALESLAALMERDEAARPQLASLFLKLGKVYRLLDEIDPGQDPAHTLSSRQLALATYSRAVALYQDMPAKEPDRQVGLIEARVKRGELHVDERRWDQAFEDLEAAREMFPDLIREGQPRAVELLALQGEAQHQLGRALNNQGQFEEAIKHYTLAQRHRRDLDRFTRLTTEQRRQVQNDLARAYGFRGDSETSLGRFDDAKRSYDRSEKLRADLVKEDPDNPEYRFHLARSYGNTANLNRERLDFAREGAAGIDTALKAYGEALKLQHELVEHHPAVTSYREDLVSTRLTMARLHLYRSFLVTEAADEHRRLAESDLAAIAVALNVESVKANKIRPYQRIEALSALFRAYALYEATPENPQTLVKVNVLLEQAEPFFTQYESSLDSDDLYYRAILLALRAWAAGPGYPAVAEQNDAAALASLASAWKGGFTNAAWARKEPVFARIRAENPVEWERVVRDPRTGK